jgi:dTDP-4-dehydrorhamnose reductase
MTRWLVTGAGGMLATDVVSVLRQADDDVRAVNRAALDVRDLDACLAAVAGVDAVVNAAAWTDVDAAEAHEADAFAVNAVGAANLARACSTHGATLVQVSSDYVFGGTASTPYPIDAPLAPLNAYGRTKAAAEWAVLAGCASSYVVRTAWLYGEHGPSFVRTMLRLADERDTLDVVDDQRGQPTWTRDLAVFLRDLVVSSAPYGVHHGTATGDTTWFGLAQEVLRGRGLDPGRVRPTTSAAIVRPAARPAYSVLANGGRLADWQDGLRRALASWPQP